MLLPRSGGVIAELLTWRWIFWIMAMVILPLAFAAFLLAPSSSAAARGNASLRNMDWLGLGTITRAYPPPPPSHTQPDDLTSPRTHAPQSR